MLFFMRGWTVRNRNPVSKPGMVTCPVADTLLALIYIDNEKEYDEPKQGMTRWGFVLARSATSDWSEGRVAMAQMVMDSELTISSGISESVGWQCTSVMCSRTSFDGRGIMARVENNERDSSSDTVASQTGPAP